jgi:hypothetical protein
VSVRVTGRISGSEIIDPGSPCADIRIVPINSSKRAPADSFMVPAFNLLSFFNKCQNLAIVF